MAEYIDIQKLQTLIVYVLVTMYTDTLEILDKFVFDFNAETMYQTMLQPRLFLVCLFYLNQTLLQHNKFGTLIVSIFARSPFLITHQMLIGQDI